MDHYHCTMWCGIEAMQNILDQRLIFLLFRKLTLSRPLILFLARNLTGSNKRPPSCSEVPPQACAMLFDRSFLFEEDQKALFGNYGGCWTRITKCFLDILDCICDFTLQCLLLAIRLVARNSWWNPKVAELLVLRLEVSVSYHTESDLKWPAE